MALNRANLPEVTRLPPQEVPRPAIPSGAEEERPRGDLARRASRISASLVIIAGVAVLAVCYVAETLLVTVMVSILLAFILEPVVSGLVRIRLPRSIAALLAILLLLGVAYGLSYFFYNRALDFARQLPKYSRDIRGMVSHVVQKKNQLQQAGEKVLPPDAKSKEAMPVTVVGNETGVITRNLGTVTELAFTLAFIPFLVYFMLSWQEHARARTVQLFPPANRTVAYITMGQIASMMRSFIAGNFFIGVFMALCSMLVFALLKLPYFYFLGVFSGFLSLIPYLGLILALFVPLTAGIGTLNTTGMIVVIVTVTALHLLSMNVLFPKFIGGRLRLNPLVVTMGLLIWGFIWGAMGLVLAVPILGAIKIICDHIPNLRPIGAWMGND
jgi:predicted PurR-regulated permease PerM